MASRGRMVELVCGRPECARRFLRRLVDLRRPKGGVVYCSRKCIHAGLRTGRTTVSLVCDRPGCGVSFTRLPNDVRGEHHYCSMACYHACVDRVAMGKKGGAVAHLFTDPVKKVERSRRGGLARARNLSAEQLHEIAMKGVAARLAGGESVRKKAAFTRKFGRRFAFGVPLGRGDDD